MFGVAEPGISSAARAAERRSAEPANRSAKSPVRWLRSAIEWIHAPERSLRCDIPTTLRPATVTSPAPSPRNTGSGPGRGLYRPAIHLDARVRGESAEHRRDRLGKDVAQPVEGLPDV